MIPYFRLHTTSEELEALTEIHRSGQWAAGVALKDAEKRISGLFHGKYTVLTSSGYAALFVAIKALGIVNQKIILPCLSTCFAISNAITASGNIPVFCDVSPEDGNCDKESVADLVKKQNIRYIISPNYAGNISEISYFKRQLGLTVIEDACQSFFSSQAQASEADITVFSFYPTKGINGIDGGAIITNNKALAEKAEKLVYYNDQTGFETTERYNFRLLNLHAAVLLSNLQRNNNIAEKLAYISGNYDHTLLQKKRVSRLSNNRSPVAHRYVICFTDEQQIQAAGEQFRRSGVSLSSFYDWVCEEDLRATFKNAAKLVSTCFCIPYFEDLSDEEITTVIKTLNYALT